MSLLGFKKKVFDGSREMSTTNDTEPKRERLGDKLVRMNRAQRRAYMKQIRLHFKHQGMKIV